MLWDSLYVYKEQAPSTTAEPCVGRELLNYGNILAKLHSAVVSQVNPIILMKFAQKN